MDPEIPLGPWKGYWTDQGEAFKHEMNLKVSVASGTFQADGEDSGGPFTLAGEVGPRGEQRAWTKTGFDGKRLRLESTRVGWNSGFVGRWYRGEACGGEFAIWPGTSEQAPPGLLDALPTESVTFRCVCGETLELPADAPGLELDCPWCLQTVVAPAAGGQATLFVPAPIEMEPAEFARCPGCASPSREAGAACVLCGSLTVLPDAFVLHPAAFDQEIVSPESADWMFRKFAWLVRTQGVEETFRRPLLFPAGDWYPRVWTPDEASAVRLLDTLERAAAIGDLSVDLVLLGDDEFGVRVESVGKESQHIPTRQGRSAEIVIAESKLEDRLSLAAYYSHSLGHLYLDERQKGSRPLDYEHLVDLVAVTLGFGLLTCEASFRFLSWSAPRRSREFRVAAESFLSQPDLCFALALWSRARGMNVEEVPRHLSVNTQSYFRKSYRFWDDRPDLIGLIRSGQLE